jgi:hypothetical protein
VYLDGSGGYLVASHDESLAPYGAITLSARVNVASSAQDTNIVISKRNMYELAIIHSSQGNQVRVRFKTVFADWRWTGSLVTFPNEAWATVGATYDGTGIRTFLNGSQIHYQPFPNGPLAIDTTSPLYIGARGPGANFRGLRGNLDQVQILPMAIGGGDTRNIVRWQGRSPDAADTGALSGRADTLFKRESGTGIRIVWTDIFRVSGSGGGCRWEVLFDDAPCANPYPLVFDKYEGGTNSNRHDPGSVSGTCFLAKTGAVKVSTRVVTPAGNHPTRGDCHTGWTTTGLSSLEAEEVP